jgi:hypothetical protein
MVPGVFFLNEDHMNYQELTRDSVHSGHIVDRCDDLEAAYDRIWTRCYNHKKDGSLGYWKRSSFTHHDFEVMRRLARDGGYLLSHFQEAVGLTEYLDTPEKPAGVHDALHQKALREARKSLWDDLTSNDFILRDFIAEQFADYYDRALADLAEERKQAA